MKNLSITDIDALQYQIIKNNIKKLAGNYDSFIFIVANFHKINANIGISDNRLKFLNYISEHDNNIIIQGLEKQDFLFRSMNIKILINKVFGVKQSKLKKIVYYVIGISDMKEEPIKHFSILKCQKTIWIEDIQYWQDYVPYIKKHSFNTIILGTYVPQLERQYRSQLPKIKIINISQFIDTTVFKNYQLPKKYDILFYGFLSKQVYPFRSRLYQLLKNPSVQNKFNIKFISHPGYANNKTSNKNNLNITGEKLAKIINESYLTICTSGKFNMLLKKYLEAGCSSSIICGNIPPQYQNLKKDVFVIDINNKMTDAQIISIITNNLKNKTDLIKHANNNCDYFQKKFGYEKGYQEIIKLL